MSNYWGERIAKSQKKLTDKSLKQIEAQLAKYYSTTMKRTIEDFENTYLKLLETAGEGKEPTPADLYKLDKYWKLQGQLKIELEKLGKKQLAALSNIFETNFFEIYYSYAAEGVEAFSTLDKQAAQQLINAIWCADGKSWSARVWENTEKLAATLNEELIACVASGKKTTELKKALMQRFDVSYNNADMLARTELAHVQTQAAQQRYKDYGIEQVEVFVDEDERTCEICAAHEGERYNVNAQMPVPFHPRCRCCMIPVVE